MRLGWCFERKRLSDWHNQPQTFSRSLTVNTRGSQSLVTLRLFRHNAVNLFPVTISCSIRLIASPYPIVCFANQCREEYTQEPAYTDMQLAKQAATLKVPVYAYSLTIYQARNHMVTSMDIPQLSPQRPLHKVIKPHACLPSYINFPLSFYEFFLIFFIHRDFLGGKKSTLHWS